MKIKTIDDYPLLLSPTDIAEIMGCSYITACRFMDIPEFPLIRMGRFRRVGRDRFFIWLNEYSKGMNR